jgi:hypothetical protein
MLCLSSHRKSLPIKFAKQHTFKSWKQQVFLLRKTTRETSVKFLNNISMQVLQSVLCESCVNSTPLSTRRPQFIQYIRNPVRTDIVALYTRIIFFTINVMRQMFMRQIVADAIPKFQKITRQMLCDKCSKNDVTLIPKNANVLWREKCWRHMAEKISPDGG